jgi:hypothetical protein
MAASRDAPVRRRRRVAVGEGHKFSAVLPIGAALLIGAAFGAPLAGSTAQAAEATNEYRIQNKCHYPVRALVHMVDAQRGWRTFGWYDLKPGETTKYLPTPNRYVFYLVQKADGGLAPSGASDGSRQIRVGAEVHEMYRINLGDTFRKYTHTFCR